MSLCATLQILGLMLIVSSCLGIPAKPTLNITGVPLQGFLMTFTCSIPTTANVSEKNSTFTFSPTNSTFNLSDTTLAFEPSQVTPSLNFSWFVNDTVMQEVDTDTMTLNVSRADTGDYHCSVQDNADPMLTSSDDVFLEVLERPIVHIAEGDGTGVVQEVEGEFVTLTCAVTPASLPVPAYGYSWSSRPLNSGKEVPWPYKERRLPVGPLSKGLSGIYTCVVTFDVIASTAVSQGLASVRLDVLYGPTIRIESAGIHSDDLYLTAGQTAQLSCVVKEANPRVPDTGFGWSYLPFSSSFEPEQRLEEKGPVLNLTSVSRSSSGQYRCQARNDVGLDWTLPAANATVNVVVQYLDNLTISDDVTVRENDVINITCSVDSFPISQMTWWNAGRKLRSVTSLSDEYVITHAQCDDSGKYTCAAANDVIKGELRASVTVQVLCAPRTTGSVESTVVVKEGGTARFSVSVLAYPPPVFRWYSPRQRAVVLTSDVPNQTHATLTLNSVEVKDSGVYVLNASNSVGFLLQEFQLKVDEDIGEKLMTAFNLSSFLIFLIGLTTALSFGIYVAYKSRARKTLRQSRMSRVSQNRWPDLLKEEDRTGVEEQQDDFYFQSGSADYHDALSAL